METVELNKIGLSVKDYKCPGCGFLHAASYVLNRRIHRCKQCWKPIMQRIPHGKQQ